MTERSGSCLCGAVRFTATDEPLNVRFCHCTRCQKAMGSPFFARALFARSAVRIEGVVARYPSSERLDRVFCPTCGARIMAERTDGTAAGLALSLFDDPAPWPPECHMFTDDKVPWLAITDGLPQFAQRPPG